MTLDQLENIINQFDEKGLEGRGTFGIYNTDDELDGSFIRANREGLELFALQILKSVRDNEVLLANPRQDVIAFEHFADWIDAESNTIIRFIEPIKERGKPNGDREKHETLKDKLARYGCVLFLIIFMTALVVGFVTLFSWVF